MGFAMVLLVLSLAIYVAARDSHIRDEAEDFINHHPQENTTLRKTTDEQMKLEINHLADDSILMLSACFLLAVIFAGSTVFIVHKGIQQIEWQRDELSTVSWHMLQTQEETARRFSHEMHDELGQSLAALRANLTDKNWMQEERRADSLQLVDEVIANIRELSQLLRPVVLDDFGLEAALRSVVDRFAQRTRIHVNFTCNLIARIDSNMETHLFRIAQEALTNIARHSRANSVEINLTETENRIYLIMQDDGIGISQVQQKKFSSMGMSGMRARARECDGTLTYENIDPHGVKITVSLPRRLETTNQMSS